MRHQRLAGKFKQILVTATHAAGLPACKQQKHNVTQRHHA
jgi:hypothetical protein